ncbi:hypothetical protein UF75_4704 [Desulfosporosinus sp. I2]|nr:hypothetical protein UF75_4704 [Desulfosporosinus sp. I2]
MEGNLNCFLSPENIFNENLILMIQANLVPLDSANAESLFNLQ